MATKEMKVCDLCQKPVIGHTRTITIDGTEYSEVCDVCIGKLNTFIKRLGEPHVSNYAKNKAKKEAEKKVEVEATPEPAVVETKPEPIPEQPKGRLGRR